MELVAMQVVRFVDMNWRMYFMLSEILMQRKRYGLRSFHLKSKSISFQVFCRNGLSLICRIGKISL